MDVNDQNELSFLKVYRPFPVNQVQSMIPSRMRGKRVTIEYPLLTCEFESVRRALITRKKYLRLVETFSKNPGSFQPLNFFEYILKCRFEYALENSSGLLTKQY